MPEPCSASGEILSAIFASLFLLSEYVGLSKCKAGSVFQILFNGFCLKWSISKVDDESGNESEAVYKITAVEPLEKVADLKVDTEAVKVEHSKPIDIVL
jgi:hypothetical protein